MIVILVILAGISINAIIGNNGVIKQSGEEAIKAKKSEIRENLQGIYLGEKTEVLMYNDSSSIKLSDKIDESTTFGERVAKKIEEKYTSSKPQYSNEKITVEISGYKFTITDSGITEE